MKGANDRQRKAVLIKDKLFIDRRQYNYPATEADHSDAPDDRWRKGTENSLRRSEEQPQGPIKSFDGMSTKALKINGKKHILKTVCVRRTYFVSPNVESTRNLQ